MQHLGPVCGFGLYFKNGDLSVSPPKLGKLIKKEMSLITWVKIETLSHTNVIYACVGGGVAHRLEVNAKYGSANGYIRWMYVLEGGAGNIFNVQTEAVIIPGTVIKFSPFKI